MNGRFLKLVVSGLAWLGNGLTGFLADQADFGKWWSAQRPKVVIIFERHFFWFHLIVKHFKYCDIIF
jgi:hypothetical protein